MTNSSAMPSKAVPRSQSPMLVLLALSLFINFIDRGNLSIAAPLLKHELGLSASQLGILLSSFFWTYASCQMISGWLVDRFDVGWVLAAGFFLWSAATSITGIVHGFAALITLRLVVGAGESVAFPSYSKILSRHFPEARRGFANALIIAGFGCGPAVGALLGGTLMARYGWRPFFIILGLSSMLWLVPWLHWRPGETPGTPSALLCAPAISQILRQTSFWGTCAGLFCGNYVLYFLLTWLPSFLVQERHLSMQRMGWTGGAAYLLTAVSALICGWLSDRQIRARQTPTRVRKTFTAGGLAAAAVFLPGCVLAGPRLSLFMLMVASVAYGMYASNLWAVTQTLAGPQAAGRWTGFQNLVGNLAGVLAPAITGLVVDRTGHFFGGFAITAAIALLGCFAWIFAVGPLKEVRWGSVAIPVEEPGPVDTLAHRNETL
ncbi:MAG: MFS transporter [Terriglobales bacterium]